MSHQSDATKRNGATGKCVGVKGEQMLRFPPILPSILILLLLASVVGNVLLFFSLLDEGINGHITWRYGNGLRYMVQQICPNGDLWEAAYSRVENSDVVYRAYDKNMDGWLLGMDPDEIGFVLKRSVDDDKTGFIIEYFDKNGCLFPMREKPDD